jgi:N-acetylmuramoyl-L-alanine amidase
MASKYKYLIDPGHGGMINGLYVTPGKRSPKFDDGSQLFEGVNNRELAKRLIKNLESENIDCIDIVASEQDVSLETRVQRANKQNQIKKSVYISLHSDAAGDGSNWHPASGISVYTSKGKTKSDEIAQIILDELQESFGDSVKWRTETSDGDEDKEEDFYVLKNTNCIAVLLELGFHTNKEEAKRMLTPEFKDKIVLAITYAIKKFELRN